MTDWAELKDAFWAAVDRDPDEQDRQITALRARNPALADRLVALLAADASGEPLPHLLHARSAHMEHPARIGSYEVLGVLGAGGMGEVYRARDSRLNREVAIKVLPTAVIDDPQHLARFEREAQVLASLNHPHVAQVYGLDESQGAPALVMELVEGPTLAEVLASSPGEPIPLSRAVAIARQIADGLDAAHEKGIVHRDLKPANVALTKDGHVKILDFGLAKSPRRDAPQSADRSIETVLGAVLGTPAYMSPEQARGLPVDKRTDIWAYGCVLYELLTGRRAFVGATASDTLVAVLERDPDMTIVPSETPAVLRSLLRHCLEKDPKRRLRDIADARIAIDDALIDGTEERTIPRASFSSTPSPSDAPRGARWPLVGIGLAVAIAALVVWFGTDPAPPALPQRVISAIVLPERMQLSGTDMPVRTADSRFALSPDGRTLAVVAAGEGGQAQLWIRSLDSPQFQPLTNTEGASFPFWSPDSASIGFVAGGRLKAIDLAGGTPRTIGDTAFRTASWSRTGVILFAPAAASPLYVVPARGGEAKPATTLDAASGEVQHGDPAFLPDGRHFLYFSTGTMSGGALDPRGIYLASLDDPAPGKLLLAGVTQARYANGHLLFIQKSVLMAQPFDAERLELGAAPFPLVENVRLSTAGATGPSAAFTASDNGIVAYQTAPRIQSHPVAFDRDGRHLAEIAPSADYTDLAISPNGKQLALSVRDPSRAAGDLWLYDLDGGRGQRLTFDAGDEFAPIWSPDGRRLLFSALSGSGVDLFVKDVHGASSPARLAVEARGTGRFAADWSRDGRFVMYVAGGRVIGRSDVWIAPIAAPATAQPLLESSFLETHARFAPDGEWFAYASNETGQMEVYVDRFPGRGAKRRVSTSGGGWPSWSDDGRELFYVSADEHLMAAAVKSDEGIDIAAPRPLFAVRPRPPARLDTYPYAVLPGGRGFIVNTLLEDTTSRIITVVLNWSHALPKH